MNKFFCELFDSKTKYDVHVSIFLKIQISVFNDMIPKLLPPKSALKEPRKLLQRGKHRKNTPYLDGNM